MEARTREFVAKLQTLDNCTVTVPGQPGLWQQAKTALVAASGLGLPFVLYTEPDKADFFAQHLQNFIAAFKGSDDTGIYLASRTAKAFCTFAPFQQMTETTINNCCAELVAQPFDYTYGPFIINTALLPHLANLPNNIGWGWRPFAFAVAHHLGYAVNAYKADFACPKSQQTDTTHERVYRMRQLSENLNGLVLAAKHK